MDAVIHHLDFPLGMTVLLSQLLSVQLARALHPLFPWGYHLCSRGLPGWKLCPFQSNSHPMTDPNGNIKAGFPWPNLGQMNGGSSFRTPFRIGWSLQGDGITAQFLPVFNSSFPFFPQMLIPTVLPNKILMLISISVSVSWGIHPSFLFCAVSRG